MCCTPLPNKTQYSISIGRTIIFKTNGQCLRPIRERLMKNRWWIAILRTTVVTSRVEICKSRVVNNASIDRSRSVTLLTRHYVVSTTLSWEWSSTCRADNCPTANDERHGWSTTFSSRPLRHADVSDVFRRHGNASAETCGVRLTVKPDKKQQ